MVKWSNPMKSPFLLSRRRDFWRLRQDLRRIRAVTIQEAGDAPVLSEETCGEGLSVVVSDG